MEFAKLQSSANPPLTTPSQLLRFSSESTTSQQSFNLRSLSHQLQISNWSLRIRPQIKLSCRTRCSSGDSSDLRFDSVSKSTSSSENIDFSRSKSGLLRDAAWIGAATFASKILGLLREIVVAAVFGVGPVATAFKYASVLPGFCSSVVGGVNGPVHVAMATLLSKQSEEKARKLFVDTISAVFLIGAILGVFTFLFAEFIVHVSAPGLWQSAEGQMSREIAVIQFCSRTYSARFEIALSLFLPPHLKLMIPCIVFSGPVGLGYGRLSAEGNNFIASIGPALSSISITASCVIYVFIRESEKIPVDYTLFGGILLACGSSLGIIFQWLIQATKYKKNRCAVASMSWLNILKDKDVNEFFILMIPAMLVSGIAQIASITDLYFASFIPGAAAALSYAYLLAMAPLGIISSAIVLPLVPTFSKLTKPSTWTSLMKNLEQAILLCMLIALPLTSTMCVLAKPIVSVAFQRFSFDSAASTLVSNLLLCYSIGSPFYIIRELLVPVFYAFGDSQFPFLISALAIISNSFLDWLFISKFCLGAQGLALATSFAHALSASLLLHLLSRKLKGLIDSTALIGLFAQLVACCMLSGITTAVTHGMLQPFLSSPSILRFNRLSDLLSIILAGSLGILAYFLLAFFRIPVVKDLLRSLINK